MNLQLYDINDNLIDEWEAYPVVPRVGETITVRNIKKSEWHDYTVIKVAYYKDTTVGITVVKYNELLTFK